MKVDGMGTINGTNTSTNQVLRTEHDYAQHYADIALSALVILLNIAEIIIISRIKRRKTIYEKLLLSLSVADGLFGLINGLQIIFRLYASRDLSQDIVEVSIIIYFFFIFSSLLHLLFISLNRVWAICSPLKHRIIVTRKRIHIAIAVLWIFTMSVTLAVFLDSFLDEPYSFWNILLGIAILVLISDAVFLIFNTILIYMIKKKETVTENKEGRCQMKSTERAVLRVCVVITIMFVFFTAPWAIIKLTAGQGPSWTHILLILNSAVNSVVYFFKGYLKQSCLGKRKGETMRVQTTTRSSSGPENS